MSDAGLLHGRPLPGPVLAVVGPTGTGKTAVGDLLAVLFKGEVVSADSMQVYRDMDIGTAKPPRAQRSVPYHCLDIVGPGTAYSAALFQHDARSAIDAILGRGALPIVVGGTGLYVRAALDEMVFPGGKVVSPTRERLEKLLEQLGPQGLHAYLAQRDPEAAALIHPNNTRRIIRALEMLDADDVSYADQHVRFAQRRATYRTNYLGLTMDRSALYARIDARVDDMIAAGLLDEVRGLLEAGFRKALTAAQAIGYKELVPVIEDSAPLDEAVAAIKQASRRYAKRQLTWFRADPRITWLDVTKLSSAEAAERAAALVESRVCPA
jgi:tRNA dimethylallyltransferase